jgi:hypothetical protein
MHLDCDDWFKSCGKNLKKNFFILQLIHLKTTHASFDIQPKYVDGSECPLYMSKFATFDTLKLFGIPAVLMVLKKITLKDIPKSVNSTTAETYNQLISNYLSQLLQIVLFIQKDCENFAPIFRIEQHNILLFVVFQMAFGKKELTKQAIVADDILKFIVVDEETGAVSFKLSENTNHNEAQQGDSESEQQNRTTEEESADEDDKKNKNSLKEKSDVDKEEHLEKEKIVSAEVENPKDDMPQADGSVDADGDKNDEVESEKEGEESDKQWTPNKTRYMSEVMAFCPNVSKLLKSNVLILFRLILLF